ncbi:unnamed protein product [Ectocarpus sp. CCAP 1310/34]|nr:unnamed protein product [Ectocarpus sp. CCAP 1310/34]
MYARCAPLSLPLHDPTPPDTNETRTNDKTSKGTGGGVRGDQFLEALPSAAPGSSTKQRSFGLSCSLAWIQETNFEDKFEVVKVIGQGSIGEVSIVRRKSLCSSAHGGSAHGRVNSFFDGHHHGKAGAPRDLSYVTSPPIELKDPSFGDEEGGEKGASAGPPPAPSGGTGERLYAMKSIHVARLHKLRVEEFKNEVAMLQQLHHPNIIQLREVFHYKKKIYMCMALCTGGQLNERSFTENQVCSVMSQVIRALVYMHETAKICHRDLKMENIMLESPDEPLVVKLIDFGLSKVFTEGDKMRTACGTVYTMAPEVLSGAGYTQKADLWSAGVIAFILLSGTFPFLKDEADLNDQEQVERLRQARFVFNDPAWKTVSAGAKGFVRGLLKKQPGFRWTAREALDHCADTWGPTFSRASFADLSSQAELAAAENAANGIGNTPPRSRSISAPPLSPSASPRGGGRGGGAAEAPLSPESPTHASRGRLRAVNGSIAKSMHRFADYGELKKAALMVTAFQLDRKEIKQLKDAFLEVDTEGNGAISLDELRIVLREHGVDGAEVDRVFGAVDMDSSGRLHYMEFLAATIEARGYIEEESLKDAFERLDVDSTGFISRDNLKEVLGKTYDNALIDKMLEEGDSSMSGSIEWEDFLIMMKPVFEQEYRRDAEAILKDTPVACREAAEVGRRAVDQTPSYAQTKASGEKTAVATTSQEQASSGATDR